MTVVEVLVTISIVALLIGLAVPAVQSAREASRRTSCANNVRSLVVAAQNFEATMSRFPGCANAGNLSPHVQMLPQLDEGTLYNNVFESAPQVNIQESIPAVFNVSIPGFVCPSDSGVRGSNYVACIGARLSIFDDKAGGAFGKGPEGLRSTDFPDGLSNTAGFSEHVKAEEGQAFDPRVHFWMSGAGPLLSHSQASDELLQICQGVSSTPSRFDHRIGKTWHVGSFGQTWYNHAAGPNAKTVDCSSQAEVNSLSISGIHPPRSRHRGGVVVGFMDGSCRFESEDIDLVVWRDLGATSRYLGAE